MQEKLRKLWGNEFAKGGLLLTISNFLVGFLNYLFNSISAKVLGPVGYSEITALFAYITIVSIPVLVITTDVIRRLGQKKDGKDYAVLSWEAWIWQQIKKWSFLIILYTLTIFFLPKILNLSLNSTATLLLLFPLTFLSAFYLAVIQAFRLFFLYSILLIAPSIAKLAGPVLVFAGIDGLNTILVLIITSALLTTFLAIYNFRKLFKHISKSKKLVVVEKRIRHILLNKHLLITVFSVLGINLLNNLDLIFVKKFFSAQEAGIYGAWSLFAKMIFYVFSPLVTLSLIFFSSQEYKKHHFRVLMFVLLLFSIGGVMAYYFYLLFGPMLLSIIFNQAYSGILSYLPLAAIFGFLYSLIFIFNNFFLAENSNYSLISIICIPIYIGSLYIFGRDLSSVININLILSTTVSAIYLLAIFYYNMHKRWKKQKAATS